MNNRNNPFFFSENPLIEMADYLTRLYAQHCIDFIRAFNTC